MKGVSVAAASLLFALLATPVFAESQPPDNGGVVFKMKGITLNLGGFLEGDLIFRTRNLNSDLASPFQSIPLPNLPGHYQNETRFTARHSRLSLLVKGDANPELHLSGYYEMDFMGAAPTANSNESNSYNPRVRHIYATLDWDRVGGHLLAGQTWSLVTLSEEGMVPRKELIPPTIDIQYVPGFTWTRQPQFRISKDWDKKYWLGLSVENAQTTVQRGGTPPAATNYANPPGSGTTGNPGSNFAVPMSSNPFPDFVVKAAADPGWGHFELYDLIRVFETGLAENGRVHNTFRASNAVGGGAILPLAGKKLKLLLSGIYGDGIGRYGSAQFPDVTVAESGEDFPLTGYHFLAGVISDPSSEWNLYAFYGREQMDRKSWIGAAGTPYGYGSPLYNNRGAYFLGGEPTGSLQTVWQATAGVWWKFYQGNMGKMQTGLQYSYTEDEYFKVINGGAPRVQDHMVFSALRYYWE